MLNHIDTGLVTYKSSRQSSWSEINKIVQTFCLWFKQQLLQNYLHGSIGSWTWYRRRWSHSYRGHWIGIGVVRRWSSDITESPKKKREKNVKSFDVWFTACRREKNLPCSSPHGNSWWGWMKRRWSIGWMSRVSTCPQAFTLVHSICIISHTWK